MDYYSNHYSSSTPFTEMQRIQRYQARNGSDQVDESDNIQLTAATNDDIKSHDKNEDNSDDDSDISDGRMCRYCFSEVDDNYSTCSCRTALCRECLEKELSLTEARQDHTMKCTVCQTQYQIEYVNDAAPSCPQRTIFAIKETFCCNNLQIQGIRVPSIRERIALALLMSFLALWTSATTYSIVYPGLDRFDGFSAELLVYLFLVFMDWCVGFSMIWFVKLVEALQLTLPFCLLVLHIGRSLSVILVRFIILGVNDGWKFAGCMGVLCTSLCVISACLRIYIMTLCIGYRRIQMRNVEIMVGGKGPFKLANLDRHFRAHQLRNMSNNNDIPQQQQQQPPPANNNNNNNNNNNEMQSDAPEIINIEELEPMQNRENNEET